jgi:hypothetical protein
MRDCVVEGCKVEVTHPPLTVLVLFLYSSLKSSIRVLPAPKKEDTIGLLENVAENDLELKLCTPILHPPSCEICKRLKDDLILYVEQGKRPVKAGGFRDIDAFGMLRLERTAEKALAKIRQVCVERDFVGVVDRPKEPLILVIPAGGDSAPRKL